MFGNWAFTDRHTSLKCVDSPFCWKMMITCPSGCGKVPLSNFMEQSPSWEANIRSSRLLMEPAGLWRCSQEPATGPYLERHESSPHPGIEFLFNLHFNAFLSATPRPSKWSLPLWFADWMYEFLTPSMRATCFYHFIQLDLFTLILSGGEYKLLTSTLCSFFFIRLFISPPYAQIYSAQQCMF